jgi:hypothetical protein
LIAVGIIPHPDVGKRFTFRRVGAAAQQSGHDPIPSGRGLTCSVRQSRGPDREDPHLSAGSHPPPHCEQPALPPRAGTPGPDEPSRATPPARIRWAVLLARIYEVLPLLVPRVVAR